MPRQQMIYPVRLSDDDIDAAVRTAYGEGYVDGPVAEQAVAGVLRNRAMLTGRPIADLARQPHQFSGYWDHGQELVRNSPAYEAVRANIQGVLNGSATNPAGNSVAFVNTAKANPPWTANGGQRIGRQLFVAMPWPRGDDVMLPPPEPGVFGQPARPFGPPGPRPKPSESIPTPDLRPRRADVGETLAGAPDLPAAAQGPSAQSSAGPDAIAAADPQVAALGPANAAALAALLGKPATEAAGPLPPHVRLADALQSARPLPAPGSAAAASLDPALLAQVLASSGSQSAYG
jgi:Cell Wall Hydrolase